MSTPGSQKQHPVVSPAVRQRNRGAAKVSICFLPPSTKGSEAAKTHCSIATMVSICFLLPSTETLTALYPQLGSGPVSGPSGRRHPRTNRTATDEWCDGHSYGARPLWR